MVTLPMPIGRQHDVVYMHAVGHLVVLGTAGCGKTTMAIHRAVHLADARTANSGPTLLLSRTNALTGYLTSLVGAVPPLLTIETFHRFARGYLYSRGRMGHNEILDHIPRKRLIGASVAEARLLAPTSAFLAREDEFFCDEISWIDGNGLTSKRDYLAAPRVGRTAPLAPAQRERVWDIRDRYHAKRAALGKIYDWDDLCVSVHDELQSDSTPRRYKHIVVDEAQDLRPEEIRSLALAIPADGSLTLFGDCGQQLFGQRVSWRSCGLSVGSPEIFRENYRNSTEIAMLAQAISRMPQYQDLSQDLYEPSMGNGIAGIKPTLVRCADRAGEIALVSDLARRRGATSRVGVLARTRDDALAAVTGVPNVHVLKENEPLQWGSSTGVYVGTYYGGKGLEFDLVLLPFYGADQVPDPRVVAAHGPDEAASREIRFNYVGVTRAKSELVITYSGDYTDLMPPPSSDLYTVV